MDVCIEFPSKILQHLVMALPKSCRSMELIDGGVKMPFQNTKKKTKAYRDEELDSLRPKCPRHANLCVFLQLLSSYVS